MQTTPSTLRLSLLALIVCYALMCYTAFSFYPKWTKSNTEATLSWDASGYYMYLPAFFIYNDLKKCDFKDAILETYGPTPNFQQAFVHKASGNYVMKYAIGQSIVMSPFFVVGHLWAKQSLEYPADGFSFPYQVCIGIGMFLIALLGLFMLRKILLIYFKDSTVSILLLLYVVGTNYLNYAAIDQAMTHNSLFTIYVFLVWVTIRFYKNTKKSWALLIGVLTGLATLIRPTEIISILIPLLWGVSNWNTLKERFLFFRKECPKLIIAAFAFILVALLQPIYWKYASGEWIVYSYEDQGFSWLHPHIWDYTMSYACGWLRYCPLMVLPLLSCFFYIKKGYSSWAILPFILCAFYITTAWDVWDYGGTAGRAMVQYYVLLAFPFAYSIEKINKITWTKLIFYPLVLILSYLNIWWTYQAHAGNIQVSGNSRAYYKAVVGRWSAPEGTERLLDNKHWFQGIAKNTTAIYSNALSTDRSPTIKLNEAIQYSDEYRFYKKENKQKWMRVSAEINCILKTGDVWGYTQFIIKFYKQEQEVQSNMLRIQRFINTGEIKELSLDAKVPTEWTSARIQFWNANSQNQLEVKKLKVIAFDE